MGYQFFSQLGEDYLLWHFFDFKRTGFFVDIGAHDGETVSNTKSFEDQGWLGICIEPNPARYSECCRSRKRVVHAACVGDDTRSQVALQIDDSGLFAGIDPKVDEARSVYERARTEPHYRSVSVPAVRVSELIRAEDGPIDFMSIDVEGTEIDVLEGLNFTLHRPRVLVIEADEPSSLITYLEPRGYMLARSLYWNHFFVQTIADVRKMRRITVDCALTLKAHRALASVTERAWSPPETTNLVEFVFAKLKQRYRRMIFGV